jgi:hypothetical protein
LDNLTAQSAHRLPPAVMNTQNPQTYQQSLDQALEETFPASDPISPSAAEARDDVVHTQGNPVDWPLAGTDATSLPGSATSMSPLARQALTGAAIGALAGRVLLGRTLLGALIGAAFGAAKSQRLVR